MGQRVTRRQKDVSRVVREKNKVRSDKITSLKKTKKGSK